MVEAAKTPDAGAADEKGVEQKKIAGKYTSVDQAIESLDKGMTSSFHETREEMSAIRGLLERGLELIGSRGTSEDQGYRRGQDDDEPDKLSPTDFLADPGKIMRSREGKLEAKLRKEYDVRTANQIAAATTVLRFQMKNPDLDEHEGLVASFMKETNPSDPLNKRLADAGKRTRTYLKKIKDEGKDEDEAGNNASGDEEVEEPTQRRAATVKAKDEDSEEADRDKILAQEIAADKKLRQSRFRAPVKQ